jgi:protein-L-isoaspartate(D-aspartate) O-methyltransferase
MVEDQLAGKGIRDERVLAAFRKVPRHLFVPGDVRDRAYEDRPLSIGRGQTISQPYMVACMTEALGLSGGEKVLEIGTGSGYQTAILLEMGAEVFSMERIAELSESARRNLDGAGLAGGRLRVGDGTLGWPEEAPFDRAIVTAGAPSIPAPLPDQLREGGILAIPVGGEDEQVLYRVVREGAGLRKERICSCIFVKLVGEEGW